MPGNSPAPNPYPTLIHPLFNPAPPNRQLPPCSCRVHALSILLRPFHAIDNDVSVWTLVGHELQPICSSAVKIDGPGGMSDAASAAGAPL